MARKNDRVKGVRNVFETSGYQKARKAANRSSGGKLGRNAKFISRRQRYYDLRVGLSLSGG